MERSAEADPKSRYPVYALGYSYLSLGDLPKARAALEKACAIDPSDEPSRDLYFQARLGLKEYGPLAEEAGAALKEDPSDTMAFDHLLQALAAQGKAEDARKAAQRFVRAATEKDPDALPVAEKLVSARLAYYLGDAAACMKDVEPLRDIKTARYFAYHSALASLRMAEAEEALKGIEDIEPEFTGLLLAAGWRAAGDPARASRAFEAAVQSFQGPYEKNRGTAELLTGRSPSVLQRVKDLDLSPREKAVLCLTLADLYPAQRGALLAMAEQLNVSLAPPHLFLAQAAAALRKKAA
jgi:tetratricopeptide (TPR) repeat protein